MGKRRDIYLENKKIKQYEDQIEILELQEISLDRQSKINALKYKIQVAEFKIENLYQGLPILGTNDLYEFMVKTNNDVPEE